MNKYVPPEYRSPDYAIPEGLTNDLRQLMRLPLHARRKWMLASASRAPSSPMALSNRRFLYRYFSMDPDAHDLAFEKKKIEDIVALGFLYLGTVDQFNDPNEFRAQLSVTSDPVARRKWLEEGAKRESKKHERRGSGRKKLERAMLRSAVERALREPRAIQDSYDGQAGEFGIACFSQNPRSNLMWAHYARSHRGICVQFDPAKCPGVLALTQTVAYRPDLPRLIWPNDSSQVITGLLSKSEEWSYEAERRYVTQAVKRRALRFDARAVTGLIVGQRFGDDVRQRSWLKDLLARREANGLPNVKLYVARKDPETYGLMVGRVSALEELFA